MHSSPLKAPISLGSLKNIYVDRSDAVLLGLSIFIYFDGKLAAHASLHTSLFYC